MSLLGRCVLLICHGFPVEDEADFNEWYIREHMPERVRLPGFNRGRRYKAVDDGPTFLAFYETTDSSALSSEPYLKLVRNFDPRSRTFVPRFKSASRTISTVVASVGTGEGGTIGLIGFEVRKDALRAFQGSTIIAWAENLASGPGIVGVHLLQADEAALNHSRQGHLRQDDIVLPWTLLVEATDAGSLDAVWRGQLAAQNLASLGVAQVLQRGRYGLLFGMSANSSLKPPV